MICVETVYIDGREFTRTYSDAGREVVREGIGYSEAYDPAEFGRTYTEGDLLDGDEDSGDEITEKAEAFDILIGEGDG